MLPRVTRSAIVRFARPGPKNSTNFPTTPCLRRRSVTVSTRSVAVAPSGIAPVSLNPRTGGISIDIGWPSIAASASMPPTPHPSTPRPLTIVVWESVPTSVSGYARILSALLVAEDDPGEIFDVDLMDDAGVRRHHAEIAEGVLPPAQKRIALAVAGELELGIQLKCVAPAEIVHLHGMVDDELDRLQRIDPIGVAAESNHSVAHRRQIDDARNAGEILKQHARGREGNFLLQLCARLPRGQRLDVFRMHEARVLVPEQILQQDFQRVRQ